MSRADGDSRQEFYIGREDGSLFVARRLLWERQPHYSLNVSVTDGAHVVTTAVRPTPPRRLAADVVGRRVRDTTRASRR